MEFLAPGHFIMLGGIIVTLINPMLILGGSERSCSVRTRGVGRELAGAAPEQLSSRSCLGLGEDFLASPSPEFKLQA